MYRGKQTHRRGFWWAAAAEASAIGCVCVNQNEYTEQHKFEPHEQIYLRTHVLATWLSVISPLRRQSKLLWAVSRKI